MADRFYGSKDPTNSVEALKEERDLRITLGWVLERSVVRTDLEGLIKLDFFYMPDAISVTQLTMSKH